MTPEEIQHHVNELKSGTTQKASTMPDQTDLTKVAEALANYHYNGDSDSNPPETLRLAVLEALTAERERGAKEVEKLKMQLHHDYASDPEMKWSDDLGWMHVNNHEAFEKMEAKLALAEGNCAALRSIVVKVEQAANVTEDWDSICGDDCIKALEPNPGQHLLTAIETLKHERNKVGMEIRAEFLPKLTAKDARIAQLEKALRNLRDAPSVAQYQNAAQAALRDSRKKRNSL